MGKKREKIKGKVATISHGCIAINRGSNHGIEEGMFIVILHIVEKDIEIIDPETDELLGHIHHRKFKGVYKVYSVEEKYALAEPSGSNKRLRPLGIFARSLLPKETVEMYTPYDHADIKVGDIFEVIPDKKKDKTNEE